MVVGEDFRGGHNRAVGVLEQASIARALRMDLEVVPAVMHGVQTVSSSGIRAALASGDCSAVEIGMGRPYRLVGTVVRGDGRGRQLGIPTANCSDRENQDPDTGVYAASAECVLGTYVAAVNIGRQPTVGAARPLLVEAHLIGFTGDCYGQRLGLDLIARLRPEQRFASLEALTAQIHQDITTAAQVVKLHREIAH